MKHLNNINLVCAIFIYSVAVTVYKFITLILLDALRCHVVRNDSEKCKLLKDLGFE